jgi:PAS domain S-box-containing protein
MTHLGLIGTALGGVLTIYYFVKKKIVVPILQRKLEVIQNFQKIDAIFNELQPNGGTSIKDTIDTIRKDLVKVIAKQRAILADTREALFETDSMGNCVWVNRTYSRWVGRTPIELTGHGWYNTISRTDRDHVVDVWNKAIKEKIEIALDFNLVTVETETIPVQFRSYIMTDSDGDVIGYFVCMYKQKKLS